MPSRQRPVTHKALGGSPLGLPEPLLGVATAIFQDGHLQLLLRVQSTSLARQGPEKVEKV